MQKDYMNIGGKQYRIEVNWNAVGDFLAAVGRDSLEELSNIGVLKPSEIATFIACAANEGERLEGRECALKGRDVGAMMTADDLAVFLEIYIRQSHPQVEAEDPAKKNEGQGEN